MPDAVLESQLTIVMNDPDNHGSVLSGHEVLSRRSAVFVDLYDAAHYGTRSILLYVLFRARSCYRMSSVCNFSGLWYFGFRDFQPMWIGWKSRKFCIGS